MNPRNVASPARQVIRFYQRNQGAGHTGLDVVPQYVFRPTSQRPTRRVGLFNVAKRAPSPSGPLANYAPGHIADRMVASPGPGANLPRATGRRHNLEIVDRGDPFRTADLKAPENLAG